MFLHTIQHSNTESTNGISLAFVSGRRWEQGELLV